MLNNYICALDIGSSKVCAACASLRKGRIAGIYAETLPSMGMKKGLIIDSIELVDCVGRVLKNLKAKSGINIKLVNANISGQDIVTKHSNVVVPLAERGNKVITLSDIQRVNEQARILGSSLEEDIIHRIPMSYSIDSKNNIANPLGLYSHRLEVDLYLICARLSSVQTLGRIVHQAGFELKELFLSGIATSEAVFKEEHRHGTTVICDIGSDITEIAVFKDGLIRSVDLLYMGGDDLSAELQNALNMPFDLAEDVKVSYGIIGDYARIDENKEILVKKSSDYKPLKQKVVSELMTNKSRFISQSIKETIEKRIALRQVSNFLVVGRTIVMEGFIETLESIIGIPVKLGRISNPEVAGIISQDGAFSGLSYLNYVTSLGIICAAFRGKDSPDLPIIQPPTNLFSRTFNRIKEVYQEYF